jgi:hypothetical protein
LVPQEQLQPFPLALDQPASEPFFGRANEGHEDGVALFSNLRRLMGDQLF